MDQLPVEVDIGPSEPAQLGGAHSCIHRCYQKWPPAPLGGSKYRLYLRFRWKLLPDRYLALLTLPEIYPDRCGRVVGDQPAPLRLRKDALQARQHFARHRPRAALQQLVTERLDGGRRQPRKSGGPDQWVDMQVGVVAILAQRGSFQLLEFSGLQPELCCLGDRHAAAFRGMDPALNLAAA